MHWIDSWRSACRVRGTAACRSTLVLVTHAPTQQNIPVHMRTRRSNTHSQISKKMKTHLPTCAAAKAVLAPPLSLAPLLDVSSISAHAPSLHSCSWIRFIFVSSPLPFLCCYYVARCWRCVTWYARFCSWTLPRRCSCSLSFAISPLRCTRYV